MIQLPEEPESALDGRVRPLTRRKAQKAREKRFMAESSSPMWWYTHETSRPYWGPYCWRRKKRRREAKYACRPFAWCGVVRCGG